MFSPQRRHTSKRPSDASSSMDATTTTTTTMILPNSHDIHEYKDHHSTNNNHGGLFSYFARARRRLAKREPDTLLPTSYAASPSAGSSPPKIRPLTCNNFLMGGHYYPGKDKKRRHMRRRTLWYRLFCSSPGRKGASFLVVTYILFWHVLLPGTEWLVQVGSQLSGPSRSKTASSNWLQYDSQLKMPELAQEQLLSVELVAARSRLQYGSSHQNTQRLQILEKIVPKWYHRNDSSNDKEEASSQEKVKDPDASAPTTTGGKETKQAPIQKDEKMSSKEKEKKPDKKEESDTTTVVKKDNTKEDDPQVKAKPTMTNPKIDRKQEDLKTEPRILQASSNNMIERTIHTPLEKLSNLTSCKAMEKNDTYSTTLVTQSSLSRLWILHETCKRWQDPIVAVVFIPYGQEKTSTEMPSCPNLRIIQYMANPEESRSENYPVNRLRNVGLDAVSTSHVLVMDIDFVPAEGLAATIREALKLQHQNHADGEKKQALVVPAFERLPPNPCESDTDCARYLKSDSTFIPKTFEELQHCMERKDCIVFQSNNNWEGHSTTRSDKWLQREWFEDPEKNSTFTSIPCFHTARYEPYVVLRWCLGESVDNNNLHVAPYYDERFHGYGKNKIELISHLRKQGYLFSILPEGFITHNPHPESTIKETWNDRKGSDLHASMDQLYSDFLNELESMYEEAHETSIKLCKRDPT